MGARGEYVAIDREMGRLVAVEPPIAPEATIIGRRVTDLPGPVVASEQRLCGACGEVIWLAKHDAALGRLLEAGAKTACLPCVSVDGLAADDVVTSRAAVEQAWLATMAPFAEA